MSIFLESLNKSGRLNKTYLTICNVGSRKLEKEDDYASKGWDIFGSRLSIYGFDADEDACEQANNEIEVRQVSWNEKHIPLALSESEGDRTLYVTKHPMCSSLYLPNENYLQRFMGIDEVMELDFTIDIPTTTLDTFCQSEGIKEIDFLQVDVQGADVQVLQGASQVLANSILAVQVEVEFSHLYVNQPLFADVDTFMRKQGFTLFDLYTARRARKRSPVTSNAHPGQILWGDAFYFRDLIGEGVNTALKTPEKIFKLACIADIMNFGDYALELLEYLTLNYGNNGYNFADNIVESLSQFPDLVEQGLSSLAVVANIRDYVTEGNLK
ncbi:FkbM family methyltransferase [Synechocystis sp. PCC 7509]|uniref:FkbM family methyltransferase n=1 Tax=Synechocystis sp. PCC 7509 TaxID=927677 RepID=UPI0002AC8189|nr:FkbM family methyltransferase [Synechocystis sp. PCC 7509]